jgi:hypothetical protein
LNGRGSSRGIITSRPSPVEYLMAAFSIVEPGDDQQDPGGRAMTASSVYELRTGLKLTALVLQATGGGWCSSIQDGMGHR